VPHLTLVVMAAGMGSRYGGLKQVEPVGPAGETILEYSAHDALAAGFDKVVLVIRGAIEREFRQLLGKRIEQRVDTRYVFQELDAMPEGFAVPAGRSKPWGTGHAVLVAAPAVAEPFAVVNADDFYGRGSYEALAAHLGAASRPGSAAEHCMAAFVLDNTLSEHGAVSRGVCSVSADGFLTRIDERLQVQRRNGRVGYLDAAGSFRELTRDSLVSMNMWGFVPSLFAELEAMFVEFLRARIAEPGAELYLPAAVTELVGRGSARVRVLPTRERWLGVTHREDLLPVREAIAALVRAGVYPSPLSVR